MKTIFFGILLFLCPFFSFSFDASLVRKDTTYNFGGLVLESESEQSLPGVTIRIADSDRGAISKKNGDFKLKLSEGKHTLIFSMVGRKNKIIDIDINKDISDYKVFMEINVAMTGEVFVIAEDPGMRIMRRAVSKKIDDEEKIQNYKYNLYTKFVASTDTLTAGRREDDTDTTIVSIFESFSNGYYDSPDNFYNEIIQKRQSANIPPQANLVTFGTSINSYTDYVNVLGNDIATPFHRDSPDFYDFILDSNYRNFGNRSIARIIATPNSQRKMFTGIVLLDTNKLAPVEMDLYPNSSVQLPFGATFSFFQKFDISSESYVIPQYMKILALIDADIFWVISPRVDIKIENYVSGYEFNKELPDGIFSRRRVESSENADTFDSTFWQQNLKIALDKKEESAYIAIQKVQENPDSALGTTMLDEIFGPINRAVRKLNQAPFTGFEDIMRYNRVQGFYFGLGLKTDIGEYLNFMSRYGYGIADKRNNYFLNINQFFDKNKQFWLGLNKYSDLQNVDYQNSFRIQSQSIISLIFGNDYYDYFYRDGYQVDLNASFGQLRFLRRDVFIRPTRINIFFRSEDNESAFKNTDFSLLGRNNNFRLNPPVKEGRLQSFGFELNYNYHPQRRFEDFGFQIGAEISNPEIIQSDFDFSQIYWGLMLRTRTLPLWRLDIRTTGGIGIGKLPPQRFFSLESSVAGFSAQRAFRGMNVKEFYGSQYWTFSFEHNFGEIIPGILRIPNIAEFGIEFLTYANIGWSKFSDEALLPTDEAMKAYYNSTDATGDKYYYEIGLGLNKLLIFFRFDVTARLSQTDSPRFFFTFTSAVF